LKLSQLKSQDKLADADRRLTTIDGEEEEEVEYGEIVDDPEMNTRKVNEYLKSKDDSKHLPTIRNNKFKAVSKFDVGSGSPGSKKEFYNKWYMPVNLWKVEKDTYSRSLRNEQLKKNLNYFYDNMHFIGMKDAHNPLKGVGSKSPQQKNYEDLQTALNQNVVIKKIQKEPCG